MFKAQVEFAPYFYLQAKVRAHPPHAIYHCFMHLQDLYAFLILGCTENRSGWTSGHTKMPKVPKNGLGLESREVLQYTQVLTVVSWNLVPHSTSNHPKHPKPLAGVPICDHTAPHCAAQSAVVVLSLSLSLVPDDALPCLGQYAGALDGHAAVRGGRRACMQRWMRT